MLLQSNRVPRAHCGDVADVRVHSATDGKEVKEVLL